MQGSIESWVSWLFLDSVWTAITFLMVWLAFLTIATIGQVRELQRRAFCSRWVPYTHALGMGPAAGPMTSAAVWGNRDLLRVDGARAGNDLEGLRLSIHR